MKNVLFTTTALAALAVGGAAFADGHSSGNFGLSGETDFGYNDEINNGIFADTDINIKASKDAGNGITVGGHVRLNLEWNEGATEIDSGVNEVEFKNIYVDTPVGKLEFADSFDGTGASDTFYKDRDGMAEDMSNGDGHAGLKFSGSVGDFNYAIDAGNISDNSTNNATDNYTIGLGGTFGPATLGFGWENNQHDDAAGGNIIGVSADFDAGIADVGISYISSDVEDAIGLVAKAELTPGLTLGAFYATNDNLGDQYGVTAEYTMGGFSGDLKYGVGDTTTGGFDNDASGDDLIEVNVAFDMGNGVELFAGYDSLEIVDGAMYAGVEVAVADGVTATVSYAEADEIDGPEFKDGTSVFMTVEY